MGMTDMWLHLIAGTVVGIAGPWALDRIATRLRLRGLLGL